MTWEERWHPLRQEWVVVAAHRNDRPWNTDTVAAPVQSCPPYAHDCYLCPGNARVSGQRNAAYTGIYVFDNDHPCVGPDAPEPELPAASVYRALPARGQARVVCYTPRHDLTLAELELSEIVHLLTTWQQQYIELGQLPGVRHVLTFENKGGVVGVSNPHPHCQIYATNFLFKTIEVELAAESEHYASAARPLFADILQAEEQDGRRVIAHDDTAIAFVPYFARYPFETYVAPRGTYPSIAALSRAEIVGLAGVLREVLIRLDNLWSLSFPYVLVLHQAPTDSGDYGPHHFHIQIHPPLRKPNLLKYLAGPEIGGGCFLNDRAPESAAEQLRAVPAVHYKANPLGALDAPPLSDSSPGADP